MWACSPEAIFWEDMKYGSGNIFSNRACKKKDYINPAQTINTKDRENNQSTLIKVLLTTLTASTITMFEK